MQQKPGKPPEDRFLRVCKVLSLEEDQMSKAVKLYQGMIGDREKTIGEEQSGELTESEARGEMQKISEHFESEFKSVLSDEQRKHLEKLKADGTLGDEWW